MFPSEERYGKRFMINFFSYNLRMHDASRGTNRVNFTFTKFQWSVSEADVSIRRAIRKKVYD